MSKSVAILGSTGSVGTSTCKVIDAFPDRFKVVLLAAQRARAALLEQARRYAPAVIAIGAEADAAWLREQLGLGPTRVVAGEAALLEAIAEVAPDLAMSAIVGAAGLKPTLAAIEAGADIGLANKESMVVAGSFVQAAAARKGVAILPVDSEHNALHQCLRGESRAEVRRLILTASGGPFRTFSGDFDTITPAQALRHPTWNMGPKISIDSATMMNKGLEVIEAHHLFGFAPTEIDIVVHPQSLVHSLIQTRDGSYLAQLSKTDMCDPIQYALTYPERWPAPFEGLDITRGLSLEFFPCDRQRFPCIQLAYDALCAGGGAPAVLNAANEVSVQAFLDERIRFGDIARINRRCLDALGARQAHCLDDLLALDKETRGLAQAYLSQVQP